MKLVTNKETAIKILAEILSEYDIFTEEENPFAAAEEGGGEEKGGEEKGGGADAEGGEEEKETDKKEPQPAGLSVEFDIASVKRYNDVPFLMNQGEVKAITQDGIKVAVDNGQTIHVNFQDITNNK